MGCFGSSLSNEGDRVFLLDNPEVLVFEDAAVLAGADAVRGCRWQAQ